MSLIEAIKSDGKGIPDVVKRWVELYERNQKSATAEPLTLLFEACRAITVSKNFKDNIIYFWDNVVSECHNGPLFDQSLFDKCLDYIIALSCTPPRVYCQIASLVGLQLVSSFINVAKMLGAQRETTQKQLNAEKKKKVEGPRVESLGIRLPTTHDTPKARVGPQPISTTVAPYGIQLPVMDENS